MKTLLFSLLALGTASSCAAENWAWDMESTSVTLAAAPVLTSEYVPIYEISQVERRTVAGTETVPLNLLVGDLVRLEGSLQVTEDNCTAANCDPALVYAFLSYRIGNGTDTRLTPYVKQHAARRENHHMPMNVAGLLRITVAGTYRFALQARNTTAARSVTVNAEAYDGHLGIEVYRHVSSPDANALALVAANSNAALTETVRIDDCGGCGSEFFQQVGDAVQMNVAPGDVIQAHSQFAANFLTANAMVGQQLLVETFAGSWTRRKYTAPRENVTTLLPRLSSSGALSYTSAAASTLPVRVRSLGYALGGSFSIQAFTNRVTALHFSRNGNRFPTYATATSNSSELDYVLNPTGATPWQIVQRQELTGASALRNGDALRAQGNLNFQFSQSTVASTRCRARAYVVDGTGSAYAVGQAFDTASPNIRGFSAVTLRELSGEFSSASLPTFAAVEVNWVAGIPQPATVVKVLNCDKVSAPNVVVPADFAGLTVELFRESELLFRNGFE